MWSATLPEGYESRKCRYRVNTLCRGIGLDLSANEEKIQKSAIGLGKKGTAVDIEMDLSANDALAIFSNDFFDYVYDAHQLGDFHCTEAVLKEWWRVVKPGGYLILYEQDKEYYPHAGTPGSSVSHKKDLLWQDAWEILESLGAEKVSASRHNDSNEYSWQLVVRKKYSISYDPVEEIEPEDELTGQCCFPRKKKTDKEVLVIRYGALGDSLWVTPVLSKLKKDGYYVVVNCTKYGARVLKANPNIDEFIIQETGTAVPYSEKGQYWDEITKGFEKVINLTQSIEGSLVKCEGSEEYDWPHEKRHAECNVNFQDRTMEMAGYPDAKGCLPEMYFTEIEEALAETFAAHHRDKFTILWGLAGSAFHKVYPWAEYVAGEMSVKYKKDIEIITVGDQSCKIIEWQNPKTINKSGVWTVRQSFIMTKNVDLVIGPDTGLMNAASCYDTPKIVLMGSNSVENLTKYWKNTQAIYAEDCDCSPCHRLVYTNSCPKGNVQGVGTKCMENIKPEQVFDAVSRVYLAWKAGRVEALNKEKVAAFTIADDSLTHRLARRVRNSFDKFHHDVPFFIYDANDELNLLGEIKNSTCACKAFEIRPRLMSLLLKDYDRVIYLDADTVVTGPLTEFLEGNYDVYGSLNIGDIEGYLNAGVSACTSQEFCDEWSELMYSPEGGKSNQVHFNNLVSAGRYTCQIVDREDVYYNERSREHWKDLIVTDEGFFCNDRQVKVLHWAGGIPRMEDKLSSSDFSLLVKETLDGLTDTTDFTDIEGVEVSAW